MRFPATGLLLALVLSLALAPAAGAQAPVYYAYPAGLQYGQGITAGAAGELWFSGLGGVNSPTPPSLVRLDVAQATAGTANGMQVFPTPELENSPCCSKQMRALDYDAEKGRVWFAQSGGYVGFATTSAVSPGTTTGMRILKTWGPDLGFTPWGIAVGEDNEAYVSEYSAGNANSQPAWSGNRIAKLIASDTDADASHASDGISAIQGPNIAFQNGATTVDSSRYDAQPRGIDVDSTGLPWFVEHEGGSPGYRLANWAGGSSYTEYLITPCVGSPCSGSHTADGPNDVTIDQRDAKWVTNPNTKTIAKFDGAFTHYSLSSMDQAIAGGVPTEAATGPDGTIWVVVIGGGYQQPGAIVKINPVAGTSTVYKLDADIRPLDVAADSAGNVWFTATRWSSAASLLGRLSGVGGTTGTGTNNNNNNNNTNTGNTQTNTGNNGGSGGGGSTQSTPSTPAPPAVAPPVTRRLTVAAVGNAQITPPRVNGTSVETEQICVGPPQDRCSVVFLLDAQEFVTGFPGVSEFRAGAAQKGKKKKRRTRTVRVGTKTVTLNGGQRAKVTITLNAKGKRLLKRFKRLPVRMRVQQIGADGKRKTIKTTKLRFRRR